MSDKSRAKAKDEDAGWTPVRDGTIYCSPRCGAKCTYAAFVQAITSSGTCAALLGEGWLPHVWENLTWHWKAYLPLTGKDRDKEYSHDLPRIDLHVNTVRGKVCGYSAWLEGLGRQRIGDRASTPHEAVDNLVDVLEEELVGIREALEALRVKGKGNGKGEGNGNRARTRTRAKAPKAANR